MRFSDKLSKQRKNNNMSQEQLADKLGVSITRGYKTETEGGKLYQFKILATEKLFNSLTSGSTKFYEVYL